MLAPFLFPMLFQATKTDVILVCPFPVWKVPQFHGFDNPIHDKRRSQTSTETKKEHAALLVAAQSLHRRIVQNLDRAAERLFIMKSDPTFAEIVRFKKRPVAYDRSGISDGDGLVFPILGELLDTLD